MNKLYEVARGEIMKIAIAGSGAIGCGFGYMLKKGGNDVTLMDFWEEHIQTIQEKGLEIDVNGEKDTIKIPIDKPGNIKDTFDVVFIFTKAMGLQGMLEAIEHTLSKKTKIVCLLNGLGHEKILAEYVPKENIIMGTTVWTASLEAPGKTSLMGQGPVEVQESNPKGKEAALTIVKVMADCGLYGVYSENVHFTTWRKACVNGTLNTLSALLDANINQLLQSDYAQSLIGEMIEEFSMAAKAEGVDLDVKETVAYLNEAAKGVGAHYPSMHQDIKNNRPTEIDFLNGEVVNIGLENDFNTPKCRMITQLIHAKEDVLGINR